MTTGEGLTPIQSPVPNAASPSPEVGLQTPARLRRRAGVIRALLRLTPVILTALVTVWTVRGCTSAEARLSLGGQHPSPSRTDPGARSGNIRLLTYNVAGLPGFLSASNPATNTPHMSPLLNAHDLVMIQEDFSYHDELVSRAEHYHQWGPRPATWALVGDGLSILSSYSLEVVAREPWHDCSGYLLALSDCLSEKGFAMARLHLSARHSVDVYNVHADAGTADGDLSARQAQFEQLEGFIARHSRGRALIVAGDTNLEVQDSRDQQVMARFLERTSLQDSGQDLAIPQAGVDRVFLRSSNDLTLRATGWQEDGRFVDSSGAPLSDHPAVAVQVAWSAG